MTLEGTFLNGVVVLDKPPSIKDGTRVSIVVSEDELGEPTLAGLLELAGAVDGLPPDLARNHDHYLHGQAKR